MAVHLNFLEHHLCWCRTARKVAVTPKTAAGLVSAAAIPVTDRTRRSAFIRLIVLSVERMSA